MGMVTKAKTLMLTLGALVFLTAALQAQEAQPGQLMADDANQLITLINEARAAAGAAPLEWDPALAAAAEQHCLLMSGKGPIEHQYKGEPSLTDRAAAAGAHFSLIEENIAIGPSAEAIQDEWMHSPPHRTNLLNPSVNRIGTAVVANHGTLYAVADFSRAVMVLTPSQVEAQVASLIRVSGVKVFDSSTQARQACTTGVMPPSAPGLLPRFLMLWQASSLNQLPPALTDKLATGRYHGAEVGSCAQQGEQNAFAAYRVAVLLY
jgi:uncharacterized protein YkwD